MSNSALDLPKFRFILSRDGRRPLRNTRIANPLKTLRNLLLILIAAVYVPCFAATFRSAHAFVVSDDTGEVLMEKEANDVVPIASLTKLLTAMVVIDAKLDMSEAITIEAEDVDTLKHSKSLVPVGATFPRHEVLRLALMSSDNRAAAALARTYPDGKVKFMQALQNKIRALGMTKTAIVEPTGLSPENRSTAVDLAKMAGAATNYPEITRITTTQSESVVMLGRKVQMRNTNSLVGESGWHVLLSKTGFTNEAGHCLIMKIREAGRSATLVLLNAKAGSSRVLDALKVRTYLASHSVTNLSSRASVLPR